MEFSVIIPTFNNLQYLKLCIKSLLKNSKFKDDVSPLDLNCDIKGLKNYSKSYLHHLIKSEEMLASMLISLHNIYFYQQFMREIRNNIKNADESHIPVINKTLHIFSES